MRDVPVKLKDLTPVQYDYLSNEEQRFFVIPSGRRSRKTLIGKRKILLAALKNADHHYTFSAPTQQQAKGIFWNDLVADTRHFREEMNKSEMLIMLKNGTVINVAGLDKPHRIEGVPLNGIHITEAGMIKEIAVTESIMPMVAETQGFIIMDGKPTGRNHHYRWALHACDGNLPVPRKGGVKKVSAKDPEWVYYHWYSSDVMLPKEVKAMKERLDPRSFRQEFEGSFESYEGVLYYTFDSEKHVVEAKLDPALPVYLTCDFNKSPMVWLVAQRQNKKLVFIKELAIHFDAKTPVMADLLLQELAGQKLKVLNLHGDSANNYTTHRDNSTDYTVILDKLEAAGWSVNKRIPRTNPGINNRVNIFCSLLSSEQISIDMSCKFLINDMVQVEDDGYGAKNKTSKDLTHASDAADYLVWALYSSEFYSEGTYNLKI